MYKVITSYKANQRHPGRRGRDYGYTLEWVGPNRPSWHGPCLGWYRFKKDAATRCAEYNASIEERRADK